MRLAEVMLLKNRLGKVSLHQVSRGSARQKGSYYKCITASGKCEASKIPEELCRKGGA